MKVGMLRERQSVAQSRASPSSPDNNVTSIKWRGLSTQRAENGLTSPRRRRAQEIEPSRMKSCFNPHYRRVRRPRKT